MWRGYLSLRKEDNYIANRMYNQFRLSLEKQVVDIFARVTFGAAGAPTLVTAVSKGVVSVTRDSAGVYTFVFGTNASMLDTYNKLLGVQVLYDGSGDSDAASDAPLWNLTDNSIATVGSASLQLTFRNTSGTATDPSSGEAMFFTFTFRNSNAP